MTRYRFGEFEFDSTSEQLSHAGAPVSLRPKASRALCLLLERSDRLVTREELRRELWGSAALEWEAGIHQVIRQVRRALGDTPRRPRYIGTVARRGYRFLQPVGTDEVAIPSSRATSRSWYRDAIFFVLGVFGLPVAVLLVCVLLAT